jgi:hypothetical protein
MNLQDLFELKKADDVEDEQDGAIILKHREHYGRF